MDRRSVLLASIGALAGETPARSGTEPTPPDPASPMVLERVTIEHITGTPPFPGQKMWVHVGLQRITFEPGGLLHLPYVGPTLFHVESGLLEYQPAGRRLSFIATGNEAGTRGLRLGKGEAVQLRPGVALYAEDGDLGPIRNAGPEPLVVLALIVVSEPAHQIAESVETAPIPAAPTPPASPDDSADTNHDE